MLGWNIRSKLSSLFAKAVPKPTMLWMCKYFFFKLFLNLLSLALCYMEMFHLNKWLHKSRSRLWPCWLRSHFSFIGTALKQCRARVPVWPVLYNLRLRQINKGPPLSSRSAQRPVCQQSSSTQLVPNRRGWHTDIHSQTQTHTHQWHSHPTRA